MFIKGDFDKVLNRLKDSGVQRINLYENYKKSRQA